MELLAELDAELGARSTGTGPYRIAIDLCANAVVAREGSGKPSWMC